MAEYKLRPCADFRPHHIHSFSPRSYFLVSLSFFHASAPINLARPHIIYHSLFFFNITVAHKSRDFPPAAGNPLPYSKNNATISLHKLEKREVQREYRSNCLNRNTGSINHNHCRPLFSWPQSPEETGRTTGTDRCNEADHLDAGH